METKPFSLQSPQGIAEDYGGDKQKIAQAMQMGILDPTAATLAGMFIDRMRSAAQAERAPQQTVAQQVFTPPAPPAPPQMPMQAPQGAPAGLGATPEAAQMGQMMAPPPAPEMPMPQEEAPPMSMADGGLASLPVPDAMFDEGSNGGFDDGYAGGGILAFAKGGSDISDEEYLDYIRRKESGEQGDYKSPGVPLESPAGALYAMQVKPATARSPGYGVAPASTQNPEEYNRVGREYALALRSKYGDTGGLAAYNMGPGAYEAFKAGKRTMPTETRNYISGFGGAQGKAAPSSVSGIGVLAERDVQTAQGRRMSREDQLKMAEELYGRLPATGYDEAEEYYRKMRDPEERRKQRREDMWMTLAQIGATMASTKSPNFLQAAGEAISAALPSAAASAKERKEAERDAVRGLMEVNKLRRGEAKEVLTYANQAYGTELEAETQQATREAQAAGQEADRTARREEVQMQINAKLKAAGIAASSKDKDIMTVAVMNKFAQLKQINGERPVKGPNEKFDPFKHRVSDETVFDNAFKAVIGTRYPQQQQGGVWPGVPPAGGQPSGGVSFDQLP